MDAALATAIIAGAVALAVQGVGVILLRRSPLAPERQAYIGDLQGRNALLEREIDDYETRLAQMEKAFDEHRKHANTRIAALESEVRRLERENLDLYRRWPELERRKEDRPT